MEEHDGLLEPTFSIGIAYGYTLPAAQITALLETVAKPRPNQSVSVRILEGKFAAEVVYLQEPKAPSYRVSYLELAQAWAAAVSARRIAASPEHLSVGDAALVIDIACGRVVLERSE